MATAPVSTLTVSPASAAVVYLYGQTPPVAETVVIAAATRERIRGKIVVELNIKPDRSSE